MKVSLISTVYNEEKSIKNFLNSIFDMTMQPDEIVIVDAGSKDSTVNIIQEYIEKQYNIKLIIEKGCNIARGRNLAIENAQYDIIAATDAGCKIDRDWLKNIIKPFEEDEKTDVVSGWYQPIINNKFEEISSELIFFTLEEVNADNFLPSSRSIAFKKSIWNKVDGYPECLTFAGEDTLYDRKLKKIGAKFNFAKDAVVFWEPRKTLKAFIKQHYLYGIGDGEAGNFIQKYIIKILFYIGLLGILFLLKFNLIGLLFVILLFLYRYKRIFKKSKKYSIQLLFLSACCDLTLSVGFIKGILDKKHIQAKKYFVSERG